LLGPGWTTRIWHHPLRRPREKKKDLPIPEKGALIRRCRGPDPGGEAARIRDDQKAVPHRERFSSWQNGKGQKRNASCQSSGSRELRGPFGLIVAEGAYLLVQNRRDPGKAVKGDRRRWQAKPIQGGLRPGCGSTASPSEGAGGDSSTNFSPAEKREKDCINAREGSPLTGGPRTNLALKGRATVKAFVADPSGDGEHAAKDRLVRRLIEW